MAFRHGVYTSEVPTSILPSRSVDSNVVVAVGTAAVHTLAAGKPVYVNKPRMFYSYDEVVSEMGWDATHFSDYTLQELTYSHFALYRGAPLVLINVFDPAKHKTSVADEAVTLADGVAVLAHEYVANVRVSAGATMQTTHSVDNEAVTLSSGTGRLAHENVSNVVVSEETDGVDNILDEGTDYTLDAASGVITRLDTGGISSPNATLNVNYSYAATEAGTAVLFAAWKPITYKVVFKANGGKGKMKAQTLTYDKPATLTANAFKRSGKTFLGWAADAGATEPEVTNKSTALTLTTEKGATVTLYAIWG